jgi:hypothetical protein
MVLHLVFFAIYILINNVLALDSAALNTALIVHSIIAILIKLNKGTKFVTPLTVFFLSAIVVSIGNIVVITQTGLEKNKMNSYMVDRYIPDATLIWCVGVTLIYIGYEAFSNISIPSLRLDVSKKVTYKLFGYVLVISLFSQEIFSIFSFLGSISKLIYLFGTIGILFYSRLWASTNERKYVYYSIALLIIQTNTALNNSYLRSELLMPTVVLFAGYFVGRGNVRDLFSFRVLPFLLIFWMFISLFSTLGKYRSNFGTAITQEYFNNAEDDFSPVSNELFNEEEDKGGSFIERNACVAQLTNCVRLVHDKGFYNGEVSAPVVYALIPRFLWPDKPLIQVGQWFAVEMGTAIVTDGRANNSINMTIMGELYMDFGWFGVIIGCFLFGWLIRVLWNSLDFYAGPYNIIGILFGGYILQLSFGFGADLQLLVTYTSTYLMLFTIKKVITDYF